MHMQGYARIGRSKKLEKLEKEKIAEIAYPAFPNSEARKKIEKKDRDSLARWAAARAGVCVCVVFVSSKLGTKLVVN